MAKSSDHISLANKNQIALSTLIQDKSPHSEWIATIAFYKAIHVIEAACRQLGMKHAHNHNTRLELLRVKNEFKPIYKHFRHLYVASCIARYLHDNENKKSYSSFDDYLEPSIVAQELVQIRLKHIEDGLLQYLSEADKSGFTRA